MVRLGKMPRIWRLLKNVRLLRSFKVKHRFDTSLFGKLKNILGKSEQNIISKLSLYVGVLLLAHILSCFWYFLSVHNTNPDNWILSYDWTSQKVDGSSTGNSYKNGSSSQNLGEEGEIDI